MTNNLCTETGYISLNHVGEQLCGDRVEIVDKENENILVLADGLGSGVKASIGIGRRMRESRRADVPDWVKVTR